MLAKKRNGVKVEVVSPARGNKLAQSDVDKFNDQYGGLDVKPSMAYVTTSDGEHIVCSPSDATSRDVVLVENVPIRF